MDRMTFYDIPKVDRLALCKNVENEMGVPENYQKKN